MELKKLTFKKETIDNIPEKERILIVQLSIFSNEISMLHKLIVFSNNIKGKGPLLTAQNIQSFFLIKLLAGKLYEGWELLRKSYFGSKLSIEYDDKLSKRGKNNLEFIKTYFGKTNVIKLIRNKYTFHYDKDHILDGLKAIPNDEELDMYLASDIGNTLYSMAHIISSYALFKEVRSNSEYEALKIIFKDVLTISAKYLIVSVELIQNILSKNKLTIHKVTHIRVGGVQNIESVMLPYFIKRH